MKKGRLFFAAGLFMDALFFSTNKVDVLFFLYLYSVPLCLRGKCSFGR